MRRPWRNGVRYKSDDIGGGKPKKCSFSPRVLSCVQNGSPVTKVQARAAGRKTGPLNPAVFGVVLSAVNGGALAQGTLNRTVI